MEFQHGGNCGISLKLLHNLYKHVANIYDKIIQQEILYKLYKNKASTGPKIIKLYFLMKNILKRIVFGVQ